MICALLIFQSPTLPGKLGHLSPWLDMLTRPLTDVVADLEAQTHRRFIKTHTPVDCLPIDDRVTYVSVGRHPFDLVSSAACHSGNIDFDVTFGAIAVVAGVDETIEILQGRPIPSSDPAERLQFFLDEDHPGDVSLTLRSVMDHYRSYLSSDVRVVRLHYSDLKVDLGREMRRLAAELDIDVEASRWDALIEAAGFEAMKARADELAPEPDTGIIRDRDSFFAVAGEGEWRRELTAETIARFEDRLAEIDPSGEVARWAVDGLYSSA